MSIAKFYNIYLYNNENDNYDFGHKKKLKYVFKSFISVTSFFSCKKPCQMPFLRTNTLISGTKTVEMGLTRF